jgi:hypothetical protein
LAGEGPLTADDVKRLVEDLRASLRLR